MFHATVCVMLTLVATSHWTVLAQPPIVTTPYGAVTGTLDQSVYAFRGIPFAQPPLGNLRFAYTEEVTAWHPNVINGSEFQNGCISLCPTYFFPVPPIMCTPKMSEDCLYLNVFTPELPSPQNPNPKLPVVVFMHGGQYLGGSGGVPLYDGADLARNQKVVVVTTNYRLGVFGALYTGTAKGNFHVTDQRQALMFVNKVISTFGGDPDLVTLTGQSAGAFSVATHLSSPKSWPYFHRAVMVSNPVTLLAATPPEAMKLAKQVLSAVNCTNTTGGDLELQCLRNVSADALLNAEGAANYDPFTDGFLSVFMEWVPVVDGEELPYQPLYALTHNQYNPIPIMFGTVANETVEYIYGAIFFPLPNNASGGDLSYEIITDALFTTAAESVRQFYGKPGGGGYQSDIRPFLSVMLTDYVFYCSNRYVGAQLTKSTPTYMWYFDKNPSYSANVYEKNMPYCVNNVCHADDLPFIFNPFNAPLPPGYVPPTPTTEEVALAHLMQTAWGNFARTGDPNPLPNIVFPRFDGTTNVLVNYSTPVSLLPGYRNDVCDFFDKNVGYYQV